MKTVKYPFMVKMGGEYHPPFTEIRVEDNQVLMHLANGAEVFEHAEAPDIMKKPGRKAKGK